MNLSSCKFLMSLVLAGLIASTSDAQTSDKFQTLFDGKTLDGFAGDPKHWTVQDGAIVGQIPPGQTLSKNTWLIWKGGELKDFDLRVQFRLTGKPAANSGIQIRCQADGVDHVSGYQADLDMGETWLGRIYDEHGRALLVERGMRVKIDSQGQRTQEAFAPPHQFKVLFRENAWNDYRIVGIGSHLAVYVNGTLFSELIDEEAGQADLRGQLAFQLHSGPETRIEFRDIKVATLTSGDSRLKPFEIQAPKVVPKGDVGVVPKADDGRELNLGFEAGDLRDWQVAGDAFEKQPVKQDGISRRWPGQVSNKVDDYFIGGYEIVQDRGQGSLTSAAFTVSKPYGSFLFGGGETPATRCELVLIAEDGRNETVIHSSSGRNREQMRRIAVDLRSVQGKRIKVRLVDENPGGWGHLNFDDFRLHDEPPVELEQKSEWRTTFNPVLRHLVRNPNSEIEGSLLRLARERRWPKCLYRQDSPWIWWLRNLTCISRWRLRLMPKVDCGSLRVIRIPRSDLPAKV